MRRATFALSIVFAAACTGPGAANADDGPPAPADPEAALVEAARQFVADTDQELRRLYVAAAAAAWAHETDITPAHEAAAAAMFTQRSIGITRLVKASRRFDPVLEKLDADTRRQLQLLKLASEPAPDDPEQAAELARIGVEMTSVYGKGKVCDPTGHDCQDLDALSKVLQTSRQPDELTRAWKDWHDEVGKAERPLFIRFVELANAGARGVGFQDVSSMWRSGYDMPEERFEAEVNRLWLQVKPLYAQLHCYVRRGLNKRYGDAVQPRSGPIFSQLSGNMWAQDWEYLYPELEPYPGVAPIDATPALAQNHDSISMVKIGEAFYTSLGMPPLPPTFWQRSMFDKPKGREVVCHPSAWDPGYDNDLRIKMCINKTQEDLTTIHHELGHDYYFASYHRLPMLFQNGANDGFHEAIGDTIALSVTPAYLKAKGLLRAVDDNERATINRQMAVALDKIAFLPFGLLVDKWRWDVFAGRVAPADYNRHWWKLKREYQGVAPPVERTAADLFDPGAKLHIASNTPYMRYFLASVLQFQFQRALCAKAGFAGPLHECSIHGKLAAGDALWKMLAMGASKPWPDALFALTGQRAMDASAILAYFAPLQTWLERQNKGQQCGW